MENSSKALVILYAVVVVALIAYLYLSLKNNRTHDLAMESEVRNGNEALSDILSNTADMKGYFEKKFEELAAKPKRNRPVKGKR